MSFRLSRKLSCFYCGSGSAQKFTGAPCVFQCRHCEATNHVNKVGQWRLQASSLQANGRQHGQPTEPPPPPTPGAGSSLRFGRPASPPRFSTDPPLPPPMVIFCNDCQRNQLITRELLASYLPDERDPSYQACLAKYPSYQKELEERYPQCCARCAPAVRQQLQQTTKVAKSDHLRRIMERSRRLGLQWRTESTLKTFVIRLGATLWWTSLVMSILWHAFAINLSSPESLLFEEDEIVAQSLPEKVAFCAQQSYRYKQIPRSCLPDLQAWMPLALIIGLLSIWWNPLLRRSQLKRGGYFVGLPTFYFLQLIALAFRWSAYSTLSVHHTFSSRLSSEQTKACHALVGVGLLMLTWLSHKAVRLEWKSPVSFRLQNKDLLPDIPELQQEATPTPALDSQPWNYLKRGPPPRFPIEALAPQSSRPISRNDQGNTSLFYNTNQPPTPPPEADVMDWSPEGRSHHTNFHPKSHPGAVLQQHIPTYPSPFHGTLPAAPVAPAARLRNPNQFSPGVFRKATEYQKDSLFKNMHISQPTQDTQSQPQSRHEYPINPNIYNGYTSDDSTLDAEQHPHHRSINANANPNTNVNIPYNQLRTGSRLGGATTTGSRPNINANTGRPRHDFPMQQPRFFPQQDTAETGLEDLFGGRSFGIDDVVATPESGSSANAGWGEWFAKGVLKARGSG